MSRITGSKCVPLRTIPALLLSEDNILDKRLHFNAENIFTCRVPGILGYFSLRHVLVATRKRRITDNSRHLKGCQQVLREIRIGILLTLPKEKTSTVHEVP